MPTNKVYSRAILISLIASLAFLGGEFTTAYGQSSSGYPGVLDIHPGLTQATQRGQGGVQRAPLQKNLSLIGFLDLQANSGTISDVWAHGKFAYVGGFGTGTTVKIVDISDPTNPQVVNELAPLEGQPTDVKVAKINTGFFNGDLLVVINNGGAPPTFGGFDLWDVTDPLNPVLLSSPRIFAVHNAFLYQKGNRAFVLLAIPSAETATLIGLIPPPGFGDFVIFEVTDPANPQMIADWGAGKDGGFPFGTIGFPGPCDICRGTSPNVFCHDVWANQNGTVAYLSYWDLGLILLDISDPVNPTFIGRGIEPPTFGSDEGNAHAAVPAQGGNLVIVGDEDVTSGPWGFLRVFDTSDPANPVQVGAFATDGALNNLSPVSSMHNIFVRGNRAYLSWYFEGIRVVDISQPSNLREIAAFIPDPTQTSPGFFWGIYVHNDLILASDRLGGLFILKLEASALLNKTVALETPTEFTLLGNYPNPFNPETEISFQLPDVSHVLLKIHNIRGEEIRTLADALYQTGVHRIHWDGKDNNANPVSSGVYFYQIKAGSFNQVKKMALIR